MTILEIASKPAMIDAPSDQLIYLANASVDENSFSPLVHTDQICQILDLFRVSLTWDLCLQVRVAGCDVSAMKDAVSTFESNQVTILAKNCTEYAIVCRAETYCAGLPNEAFHPALDILFGLREKLYPSDLEADNFLFWHDWWKLFWHWPFSCSPFYYNGQFPVSLVAHSQESELIAPLAPFEHTDFRFWQRLSEYTDLD